MYQNQNKKNCLLSETKNSEPKLNDKISIVDLGVDLVLVTLELHTYLRDTKKNE